LGLLRVACRWLTAKAAATFHVQCRRGAALCNMACGIVGERLMLRLGEEGAATALAGEHVVPMDFTGKPIRTMVFVEPAGIGADADLGRWVGETLAFAKTLQKK
jgi:hypothetical protein